MKKRLLSVIIAIFSVFCLFISSCDDTKTPKSSFPSWLNGDWIVSGGAPYTRISFQKNSVVLSGEDGVSVDCFAIPSGNKITQIDQDSSNTYYEIRILFKNLDKSTNGFDSVGIDNYNSETKTADLTVFINSANLFSETPIIFRTEIAPNS